MSEILLPVGLDEQRAVSQATAVSGLPRAADEVSVTVLHVFIDNEEGASVQQVAAARRARDLQEDAGVDVTFAERSGDPATEILDFATEADMDFVCVGGRKRTPAGKVLFG